MGTEVLAAGMAAVGVTSLFGGLALTLRGRTLDRRIEAYVDQVNRTGAARAKPVGSDGRMSLRAVASDIARALNVRLRRTSIGTQLQVRLSRAGLSLTPSDLFLILAASTAGAGMLGMLLALLVNPLLLIPNTLAAALAGALVPLAVLRMLARRRLAQFEAQLPQAVDAMAGTLQAGSSLTQALESISREMTPPISSELRRVLRDCELGLTFSDSLAALAARIASPELLLLTSAVSVQQRVGGDLAPVLRSLAQTVRERQRLRSEVNVLTAQTRYSAYIVAALPLVLFAFLWVTNFDYLSNLFLPGLPRILFGGAVAGMILGYISVRRIASVEL